MAILKSVIPVNNGNTGWSKKDVLDALETAFSQLGFHGGSALSGSPVACLSPVNQSYGTSGWENVGGVQPGRKYNTNRSFYVTTVGTGANSKYIFQEQWTFYNYSGSNYIDLTENTINVTYGANGPADTIPHYIQTGDAIRYFPGETNTQYNIGNNVVIDTVYYAIKSGDTKIKLATTAENAANGIAIDLTAISAAAGGTYLFFRREPSAAWENPTIDIDLGDTVTFIVNDPNAGDFYLMDTRVNTYSPQRILSGSNFDNAGYREFPTGMGVRNTVNGFQYVNWVARGWQQSETEPSPYTSTTGIGYSGTNIGYSGTFSYGYANSVNSSMKGTINLVTRYSTWNDYNLFYPYWKYTVPASGTRSELKLRIYRYPRQNTSDARIAGVQIHSIGSGWSDNEVFTIPGSATGHGTVNGTNDIKFGINAAETSSNANNGVASIKVTNYGAGSSFWQKSDNGYFAVLKNVNDASKSFGTTYYTFGMSSSNSHRMYIGSGCIWETLNTLGTKSGSATGNSEYGSYGGDRGLDYQEYYNYITTSNNDFSYIDYASTSTPTAYPLSIRTYRAQAPQDNSYAVIQFTQTINGVVTPFATFSLNRGINYGSGVWDTNHVWNGGYTEYTTDTRSIDTNYHLPAYANSTNQPADEPADNQTLARAAEYGYLRDPGSASSYSIASTTRYSCNIDTNNIWYDVLTYYRNSTYDSEPVSDYICFADRERSVSSNANYYKPIKGLPIGNNLVPCPYYIPDDFVILQVATSPGLTEFRTGDTVTISASEVYEIIRASYQTNQNGLDNINNNSSIGMLFCARVT